MKGSIVSKFPWLKNVDLYITTACNRNCRNCMAYDIRQEGIKHMDEKLFYDVVDSLKGIDSVHLAGIGEPCLHPNFFEFLNYAGERAKEIRINTSGLFLLPLHGPDNEVVDYVKSFPKNLHIFLSTDEYHEDGVPPFGLTRMALGRAAPHISLMCSVRLLDKAVETEDMIKNNRIGVPYIVNRVLKMGKAKNMKDARYVDLRQLLENHIEKPMIGILHDGTVVSNFIAAYLPKSSRPSICELGNLNEKSLSSILRDYDKKRRKMNRFDGHVLCSMIDDMKEYPFVVESPWLFDLRDSREEIMENTLDLLVENLGKFHKPCTISDPRLVSTDSNLRYDLKFSPRKETNIDYLRHVYRDMFEKDVTMGGKKVSQKEVTEDKIVKLCALFDSHFIGINSIPHGSPEFWKGLLRRLGLPEEEWRVYVSRLILGSDLHAFIYKDYLPKLGITKSNYNEFETTKLE